MMDYACGEKWRGYIPLRDEMSAVVAVYSYKWLRATGFNVAHDSKIRECTRTTGIAELTTI